MTSLKNNPVIAQLQVVMGRAIALKEQFDLQKLIEVLAGYEPLYKTELDKLIEIAPSKSFLIIQN